MANTHVLRRGSYANGFAPRDFLPYYHRLQSGQVLAMAPCLGPTGVVLKDWGGYKNDGTLTNFTLSTDWVQKDQKTALSFNGTNAYVTMPHRAAYATATITVGGWVNITAKGSTNSNGPILIKGTLSGDSTSEWSLYYNKGLDRFRFFIMNASNSISIVSANTLGVPALNTWYFVEGKYDGATLSIWINGVLDTSTSVSSGLRTNGTASLFIGDDPGNANCFLAGYGDDWFIKTYATTASESITRYAGGFGRGIAYTPKTRMFFGSSSDLPDRLANLAAMLDAVAASGMMLVAGDASATNNVGPETALSTLAAAVAASASGSTVESVSGSGSNAVAASTNQSVDETMSGTGATGIVGHASGTVQESLESILAGSIQAVLNTSLQDVSESATAANAVASTLSQALQDGTLSAVSVASVASILSQTLQGENLEAVLTVASGASLSQTIGKICLAATGTSPLDGRVAVLIQTLQDVHLVAVGGTKVFGPFRIVRSIVTLPGSIEVQINLPGSEVSQINLPGSVRTVINAEH
jgi:hypothetical protein